jgi:hypothetical protein
MIPKRKIASMIHHCSHCNTPFTANRKDKKYCSNSCKQMAFLKRQWTDGTLLSKHQNVNLVNHQLTEIPESQNVKPSNAHIDVSISKETESKTVNLKSLALEHIYKPVQCKWINEIYQSVKESGNSERLNYSATDFGEKSTQVEWVSIHYRCLLECVITLSQMRVIEWDSLAELVNAFIFMISSTHFKDLPDNYPFTKNIIALKDQLKKFCLENKHNESMQFRSKFDTKKHLFLQRFELSLVFPKITFNQLQSNFKVAHKSQ